MNQAILIKLAADITKVNNCQHLDFDEYFETCPDCNMTLEQIEA